MERDDERPIREQRAAEWRRALARPEPADGDLSRRAFVRLMGASLGLAGVAACTRAPRGRIVPYVEQPPEANPGVPRFYATSMSVDGYAMGLLAESNEGRPTKIEGNPEHPDSLGATGPIQQAWVLSLYDPERARQALHGGEPATWAAFVSAFVNEGTADGGAGLHVVMEPTSSPTLVDLIGRVRARLPKASFHFWSPASRASAWDGARLAFGRPLEARFDLRGAETMLVLGGDVLAEGPGFIPRARAFADGRRIGKSTDGMNRLYVAEAALTSTGSLADHRLALREQELPALACAIAARIVTEDAAVPAELRGSLARWASLAGPHARWADAVARDLLAHKGASAVMVGDRVPAEVHALAHWMNDALGNAGRTVTYADSPIFQAGDASHDLALLTRALSAGEVDTLVVLGTNAVYASYADVDLGALFARAKNSVYLGAYHDETGHACGWFLPETHGLEAWGDGRATDGTVTLQQPLIERMFDSHQASEVLAVLAGELAPDARALFRAYWARARSPAALDAALAKGLVDGTASAPAHAALDRAGLAARLRAYPPAPASGMEIRFALDPRVHDGRFTDNAWLLELPEPVTQLSWDNAALVSPATAARLGVSVEDVVELTYQGRTLRAPVYVAPGHADDSVTLTLGFGRGGDDRVAAGVGYDAYRLRTSRASWCDAGVTLRKTGETAVLARAQLELDLHGRDDQVLLHRDLDELRGKTTLADPDGEKPKKLYLLAPDAPRQWGMVVDLNACVGCNACVVACQAENNVPVVGKLGVAKGRRMHWMRIDRYVVHVTGGERALPQPMYCQHCEAAPCEYVCPVNATTHSADGLNQMIYNRCVGTRFCSNNCPYKVRRFNYFDYGVDLTPVETLVKNPDVTVRQRGVMEKCTYCVQRIREKEIAARVQGRPLNDGEIKMACEQACPSNALVFGDVSDRASRVSQWSEDVRAFSVLGDLGTRPRTRYLARIFNPNPELA